jgi:hypothetical protein
MPDIHLVSDSDAPSRLLLRRRMVVYVTGRTGSPGPRFLFLFPVNVQQRAVVLFENERQDKQTQDGFHRPTLHGLSRRVAAVPAIGVGRAAGCLPSLVWAIWRIVKAHAVCCMYKYKYNTWDGSRPCGNFSACILLSLSLSRPGRTTSASQNPSRSANKTSEEFLFFSPPNGPELSVSLDRLQVAAAAAASWRPIPSNHAPFTVATLAEPTRPSPTAARTVCALTACILTGRPDSAPFPLAGVCVSGFDRVG